MSSTLSTFCCMIFQIPRMHAHALSLKFPIVVDAARRVDWRRVEVAGGHWSRLIGCEEGLTVEKTTKHVIVHADEILHKDPNEAFLLGVLQCLRLARVLEDKFEMRLGAPSLLRAPHFGVYAQFVAEVSRFFEFSGEVGKIDQSEGYAEIEYNYPQLAKEMLLMPIYVRALLTLQRLFAEGMADHRVMINEIRVMAEEIRQLVEMLRKRIES